ncbi:CysJI operon transcriptional activator [Serratia ficaria]|uniref:LysR substrate-binding domain-containing protein n=1 Tax=Serratia ficaria TaxID=61651 RepID=UPI00119911C0|nr:LysR family transcriptional regulator [Serratia ficaria]CAI1583626.1 CysJI operon transcriptional activator [Serratia ficaria]VVA49979.1 HTH-type transcriptional regulator CysL [Serratia ficaria]
MFNWEDLHYFMVFAREKSLSGAARSLQVDHATVARRIASLEASLQLKLVDRRPRSYLMTADGLRIAEQGDAMALNAFAVGRAALGGRQGVSGEVTLSVPPVMGVKLIAPRLGELQRRYPDLRPVLLADTANRSLLRGEADIAVRLSRANESDLVARKIGTVEFGLYADADYLQVTPDAERGFIGYHDDRAAPAQQRWLLAQAGSRPLALRSNDLMIQAAAAVAGAGVALLPHFVAQDAGLQRLSPEQALSREIWLTVHDDIRHAPGIVAVTAFLLECYAGAAGITRLVDAAG